jgi:hypothetical protein
MSAFARDGSAGDMTVGGARANGMPRHALIESARPLGLRGGCGH